MARPDDTREEKPIPPEAWAPAVYGISEYAALQALNRGEANQLQQKLVLTWIIEKVSRYYDVAFRPDSEGGRRDTDFACGRGFVGQQLVTILKSLPPKKAKKQEEAEDDGRRDQR